MNMKIVTDELYASVFVNDKCILSFELTDTQLEEINYMEFNSHFEPSDFMSEIFRIQLDNEIDPAMKNFMNMLKNLNDNEDIPVCNRIAKGRELRHWANCHY